MGHGRANFNEIYKGNLIKQFAKRGGRQKWLSYSGYQSHATLSRKTSRQNLSFGGRQSSPPPCRFTWKTEEYSLKPCSGPLVKIIILLSLCTASSLNTLALNIPWKKKWRRFSGFSTAIRMHECPRDQPNCTRVKKLFLRVFSWGYGLNNTKPAKTYNL